MDDKRNIQTIQSLYNSNYSIKILFIKDSLLKHQFKLTEEPTIFFNINLYVCECVSTCANCRKKHPIIR